MQVYVLPLPGPGTTGTIMLVSVFVFAMLAAGLPSTALTTVLIQEFANVPPGRHTAAQFLVFAAGLGASAVLLHELIGTPAPFGLFILYLVWFVLGERLLAIRCLPVVDIYGECRKWSLGSWLQLPASVRFNLKTRADLWRASSIVRLSFGFGFAYPLLAVVFTRIDAFAQGFLVGIFFLARWLFGTLAEQTAGARFGSDGMTLVNFFGVAVHEVCLSVMLTSTRHPALFVGQSFFYGSLCMHGLRFGH